ARSEIALEHAIDELAHELVIGHFLDLGAVDAGESLAERGRLTIRAIDRGIEGELVRRHLASRANLLRGFVEELADFVFSWITLQHLAENGLGAGEANELRILVERDAHGPRLL